MITMKFGQYNGDDHLCSKWLWVATIFDNNQSPSFNLQAPSLSQLTSFGVDGYASSTFKLRAPSSKLLNLLAPPLKSHFLALNLGELSTPINLLLHWT